MSEAVRLVPVIAISVLLGHVSQDAGKAPIQRILRIGDASVSSPETGLTGDGHTWLCERWARTLPTIRSTHCEEEVTWSWAFLLK